jgi:Fe-S oxidoreductase
MTKENIPYIPPVLDFISANIERQGNPLALPDNACRAWAEGLNIPSSGKTILYTGGEYQMAAYLSSLTKVLKKVKFAGPLFSAFKGIQAATGRAGIDLIKTYGSVAGNESETYNRLLRMSALILKQLGVEFAYLEGELYSGALLYEYGLFESFEKHARRVVRQLHEAGINRIIALSPHSAEVFQCVYPQFVGGFDFEVVPYISIVSDTLQKSGKQPTLAEPLTLTIHDPCHLARTLQITDEPRQALATIANLEIKEVALNKNMTTCCGAPCEIVYPELAEIVASRRLAELAATGADLAVTLCPFCHANLTHGTKAAGKKLKITDIVEIIWLSLGVKDA